MTSDQPPETDILSSVTRPFRAPIDVSARQRATNRSDPFASHARTILRLAQGRRQPDDFEGTQQVAQVVLIAIVMRQKVIIQFIEIRTLVDKGVRFDFGNLPGSDPLAQQPIIEGVRTWKIDQQQPSRLEYASDLPERPYDPIPSVMVDR